MRNRQKTKAGATWTATRTQCLIRNNSSGVYYARFRASGKLVWKSLDTDNYETARIKLPGEIETARKFAAGGDATVTFAQAVALYRKRTEDDARLKPQAKRARLEYLVAISKTWQDEGVRLAHVKPDDVRAWSKSASHYSPSYYNHVLHALAAILDVGIEHGALRRNPARDKTVVKRRRDPIAGKEMPSLEQMQKFIHAIETSGSGWSKKCANLVRLLAFTGLRVGEAKQLTWRMVDFKNHKLHISGNIKQRAEGSTKTVQLIPTAFEMLKRWRKERHDESADDHVAQVFECQKAMDNAARKLGMPRLTHHGLRHFFSTLCLHSGANVRVVADWLGHSDGGALLLKRYGHVSDEISQQQADKMPAIAV